MRTAIEQIYEAIAASLLVVICVVVLVAAVPLWILAGLAIMLDNLSLGLRWDYSLRSPFHRVSRGVKAVGGAGRS